MAQASKYEPIWHELKEKGECRITAPAALHRRIVKAVIKRKDLDHAYKLACRHLGFKAVLEISREHSVITFVLKKYPQYSYMHL